MSIETKPQSQPLTLPPAPSAADAEVDIEVLQVVPQQFAIDSEESCNWLIRKIVAARDYAVHVKAWADREVRRAQREEATLMFLFGRQAERWTRGQIERLNGRRKSLNLPAGIVGFRKYGPLLVIDDDARVVDWARHSCPTAVITTMRLSKSVLNDHFAATGEAPDGGAHIEPERETFFIR